ncbi:MAG: outer membrane lipid asymmetry maintenance protein MlaD [Alphaproteobacteria bacterium]|nr:outer membrane lipid asymmetry maintenance protein MlaD [Alphaproteobacteria bacterium]
MKRSTVETALGALVILVAAMFLSYSYKTANLSTGSGGYEVVALFSSIGGLQAGDDVQISGVKVGNVSKVELDKETYLAKVHLNIDPAYKLPVDTAALISSESLLGGKYLALEPGADEELLGPGGTIEYTQAPQNLEQLLGQFIFSMQGDEDKKKQGQ